MFKNLKLNQLLLLWLALTISSCASSSVKWQGDLDHHVETYLKSFERFRERVCVPRAQTVFEDYLKAYRGQGIWIPEFKEDVDVESLEIILPELQEKLAWITKQKQLLKKKALPAITVTGEVRYLLKRLLELKKSEILTDEAKKVEGRKLSLSLQHKLFVAWEHLIKQVPFLTNFRYPVDHLKNRKVYDSYKDLEDNSSVRTANHAFLLRKLVEDGAYNPDHTGSDIYLRTTMDTLYFELRQHDFYLTEDARFDLEFVLSRIDKEIQRGKNKLLERLTEWETRTRRTMDFYSSLTRPENQRPVMNKGVLTSANKELIREHNQATHRLKEFVYTKQAEVYKHWLEQPELARSIFVLETILMNEVGGVDGDDALERMDVARVVMNRLDKPKYLALSKKDFIYPYLKKVTADFHMKNERWLNALFKQGEFSFTYYYMSGVAMIFCPDLSPSAKKLRQQNVAIALQVLKEGDGPFKATRYFSRASMIGRIHMDSIWEDYQPYPERPGLLASGQEKLHQQMQQGAYSYLYAFKDPEKQLYQVIKIGEQIYAMGEKNGVKLFYYHRSPHYFRYFTKTSSK